MSCTGKLLPAIEKVACLVTSLDLTLTLMLFGFQAPRRKPLDDLRPARYTHSLPTLYAVLDDEL